MKLKKLNATLGLLSIFFMLVHIGYSVFAYLTMYYNPTLKTVFSVPFIVLVCLHAVCGMSILFMQKDGRGDLYKKQNMRTVLQRVTAALIFPLLILHLNTFSLMQASAEKGAKGIIIILIAAELLFFGVVITHVATSFTNGFVTLGLLSSEKTKNVLDKTMYVICFAAFVISAFAVIKGQAIMFLH
ncbi:MAG: hypothetical protein E7571_03460 [Ruminococcaceae bacterium]|nr:hypothetical protein [Oscillospiraceae bacterium]